MVETFVEARKTSEVRSALPRIFLLLVTLVRKAIRTHMREMGNLSGVPIEPPEQTELLDACVSIAGVIGGGVPGGEFLRFLILHPAVTEI